MKYKICNDLQGCRLEMFLKQKKKNKTWRVGKRNKNQGSAVKGQLFYSDLQNCFSASVLVMSLILKPGL